MHAFISQCRTLKSKDKVTFYYALVCKRTDILWLLWTVDRNIDHITKGLSLDFYIRPLLRYIQLFLLYFGPTYVRFPALTQLSSISYGHTILFCWKGTYLISSFCNDVRTEFKLCFHYHTKSKENNSNHYVKHAFYMNLNLVCHVIIAWLF